MCPLSVTLLDTLPVAVVSEELTVSPVNELLTLIPVALFEVDWLAVPLNVLDTVPLGVNVCVCPLSVTLLDTLPVAVVSEELTVFPLNVLLTLIPVLPLTVVPLDPANVLDTVPVAVAPAILTPNVKTPAV